MFILVWDCWHLLDLISACNWNSKLSYVKKQEPLLVSPVSFLNKWWAIYATVGKFADGMVIWLGKYKENLGWFANTLFSSSYSFVLKMFAFLNELLTYVVKDASFKFSWWNFTHKINVLWGCFFFYNIWFIESFHLF